MAEANTKDKIFANKVKRIQITNRAIVQMAIANDKRVPRDAEPKGMYHDYETDSMWVIISSSEFEEVKEGDVIPVL